jgi:hypothetical protein
LTDESRNPQSSLQRLSPTQQGELKARLDECKSDLRDVKKVLHQYQSLDTNDPRFRDRLAFTTGKQSALRERISTHSQRIQQFLSVINIATFSRIERNTEAQLVSLSEILARLERMHGDLLSGKQDPSILQGISAVTAVEKEILRDDVTEVDVDLSHVVSRWLNQVKHEHETATTFSSSKPSMIADNNTPMVSHQGSDGLPQVEETADTEVPAKWGFDAMIEDLPPLQPQQKDTPIVPSFDAMFPTTSNIITAAGIEHIIDIRSAVPQAVTTPHRQSGYDYVLKQCTSPSHYSTTLERSVQAVVVCIVLSHEEWTLGTTRTMKIKRTVFKKSTSRDESSIVTIDIPPKSPRQTEYRIIYRRMGNRTMRDSRLLRGAEALVSAEHVVFRFHTS